MKRIYKKMKDKIFVQNLIPVCQLVSWRDERKKGGVFRTVYRDKSKVRICINLLHTGGTLKLWNRQMFIPSGWKDIDVLKFEIVAIRLISFDQNLHNSAPYDNNGHHAKLVECSRGSDEFRGLKSYDRIYIKSTNYQQYSLKYIDRHINLLFSSWKQIIKTCVYININVKPYII